jgi:hypothetical protein
MEINGLPVHPLIVHAAVVLLPMAAVLASVHACVTRWRWATRWPTVAVTAAGLGTVVLAYFSGKDFIEQRYPEEVPSAVLLHEERGEILLWVTVVFTLVVLLAAWGLGGPSALASGWGARGRHDGLVEWSLVGMVLFFALAVLLMAFATGEAGARAVWGG